MTTRRGFALLTVLWLVIAIGTTVTIAGEVARRALVLAQRERDRTVGRWFAEGCVAQARVVVDRALARVPLRADRAWRAVDTIVAAVGPGLGHCELAAGTEGRAVLGRATAAELDSLPGMSSEAVAAVLGASGRGVPVADPAAIAARLSPKARARFETSYAAFVQHATVDPDVWVVRSRVHVGMPPAPVSIEAAFVRVGDHAAVVRWREW